MPKDDYTSAGGGLKLKGAKNAGIDKKKKKKEKSKKTKPESDSDRASPADVRRADNDGGEASDEGTRPSREVERVEQQGAGAKLRESLSERELEGKTEAERRHEEMRRRRLNDRLAREGVKTHKERVEELNKYLSTLSEHHDMPRIGPG